MGGTLFIVSRQGKLWVALPHDPMESQLAKQNGHRVDVLCVSGQLLHSNRLQSISAKLLDCLASCTLRCNPWRALVRHLTTPCTLLRYHEENSILTIYADPLLSAQLGSLSFLSYNKEGSPPHSAVITNSVMCMLISIMVLFLWLKINSVTHDINIHSNLHWPLH